MDGSSPMRASGSPVTMELTPRSKVAKMLADIDNAPTPSPPTRVAPRTNVQSSPIRGQSRISPIRAPDARPSSPHSSAKRPKRGPFHVESDENDDDDLDAVRRPLGRAARRMLSQRSSPLNGDNLIQPASSPPNQRQGSGAENDDEDLYSATPLQARSNAVRSMSGSPLGSESGGLFVSPAKSVEQHQSDEELPSNPFGSKEKLAELVARKREERMRREAEESQKPSKKRKHRHSSADPSSDLPDEVLEGSEEEAPNPDVERLMSDAARPTRKASKKALLEMERETQRLARQQALAHQMKVKKKFTTSDLLARFNVRQPQQSEPAAGELTAGSSSVPNSDDPEMPKEPVSTPPSSPPTAGPTPLDKQKAIVEQGALSKLVPAREDSLASLAHLDSDEELPDIADVLSAAREAKKNAVVEPAIEDERRDRRGLKLARLGKKASMRQYEDSSDDDLEIIAPLPKHLQAFDKVKPMGKHTAADNKAIHTLRHLSNIGAYGGMPQKPGKGPSRPSIGPKALEAQLRRKAKDQARAQQQERIAELKAKGIVIQTAEEREREAEVFEDSLEKARQEAVELRKAEKAAAKEAGVEGLAVEVSDDEDEDDEYVGSGSEEEGGEGDDVEDEEEREGLVDGAAEESGEEEAEVEEGTEAEQPAGEDEPVDETTSEAQELNTESPRLKPRKPRQSRIVADEDDEDAQSEAGDNAPIATPANVAAADEDPFAAFGFGANAASDPLMSPTQAFRATMQTPTQATQEDSFDILRKIAPPSASTLPSPAFPAPSAAEETQQPDDAESQVSMVPGSQVPESQRINLGWETQAPGTPVSAGLQRGVSGLSETPGWEPTQDAGLPSPWTIAPRRESTMDSLAEEDRETQETVLMRVSESPAPSIAPAARRGRLVRRQAAMLADSDSEDELEAPAASAKQKKKDAFREMARRRNAALTAAERTGAEKEMKQMLEEQAEESEDEYAGLGGDDFVAAETEEDRAMIDSSHIDVDERALAAHFAEKQRVADEAATSKLYKDLTTGLLRRKAGNAFDLEEDEDEVAMRRRQMRQLEEARKRKLLLQDDNIAGLAQGRQSRGKDAFLKAIADDDERDDDMLDLSDAEEDSQQPATQDESQSQPSQQQPQQSETEGPLREVSGNKRRLAEGEDRPEDRPPAKQRRTQASAFRKPTSMLEVRESLTFLLDEPETGLAAPTVDLDSDTDKDDENEDGEKSVEELEDNDGEEELERLRNNDGGFAPNPAHFDAKAMPPPRLPASQRRTAAPAKPAVVDRLSLKRASSSSDSAHGRTAWAAPVTGGFKAPSLLRRATTNMSASAAGANDRGVTTGPASLSREGSSSGVKMGGSKKSSLAYQARAEERREIVEASKRRREENTRRIAEMRRNSSALGKGLTGRFE